MFQSVILLSIYPCILFSIEKKESCADMHVSIFDREEGEGRESSAVEMDCNRYLLSIVDSLNKRGYLSTTLHESSSNEFLSNDDHSIIKRDIERGGWPRRFRIRPRARPGRTKAVISTLPDRNIIVIMEEPMQRERIAFPLVHGIHLWTGVQIPSPVIPSIDGPTCQHVLHVNAGVSRGRLGTRGSR